MTSIIDLLFVLVQMICVIIVIAYLITRTKYFEEILDKKFTLKNRLILILIFSALSIYGTYWGVEIFGAIANVRDLGPMIGGLIGGPIIGVPVGLVGAIHRFSLGGFTAVPCSLATLLAGLFGGIIYILKKGKFIGIVVATIFAGLIEVFHMIITLLIAQPYSQALSVVENVSVPMILSNSLGVMIFTMIVSNRIRERRTLMERNKYLIELEQKKQELKIANDIQRSFLPETAPKIEKVDIAASTQPAIEVGGDFYDFIPITADKWGLVIADVSGKGIPAALFMALSRTLVRASTAGNPTVANSIEQANKLIFADAKSSMFVTLFYAILDLKHKCLRFVNAGHYPPILRKNASDVIVLLKAKGIALGVIEDIILQEMEIELATGDVVILYTDGIIEAVNDKEEQFTQERLYKIIRENYNRSAQEILEKIRDEVKTFTGNQPQFDDITLMILKVK